MGFRVGMSFPLPEYYDYLREHGFDVVKVQMLRNDEDETIEKMHGFEAVAAMGERFTPRVLDALKDHLQIVVRHGIGYDRVDIDYAAQVGICCCNTPGTMSSGVAETTLAMMLECLRQFYKSDREIKDGGWNKGPVTRQLEGSTIGLVGFGNIAQRVAQYLQGFCCRILAHDVRYNEVAVRTLGVQKASLDEIAAQSDIVSVHVPHLPETTDLINAAFLAKMKPTAYLINTSRGGVVDEPALIRALKDGIIAGAGLDVFRSEPMEADNELRKLDNVFLTAHLATNTHACIKAGFDGIMQAFNEFRAGQVPRFCLNPSYVENVRR